MRLPQKTLVATLAALLFCGASDAATPKAKTNIAVLDFDFFDTSGEPTDQTADHLRRRIEFADGLRRDLDRLDAYRVVLLECPKRPCTARDQEPEELFAAAKKAGARLILFGGIHKISTLIQWAQLQLVDVQADKVVDDRRLSFRGDSDEAWRRAEAFVVEQLSKKK